MSPRTRVKICGMTRPQDAAEAARLGVDAIGLVFYEKSPRHVSIEQARDIIRQLPSMVTVVALFLDPKRALVDQVLAQLAIDLIQFHGKESAEFCESFEQPYIKALGMAGADIARELSQQLDRYSVSQVNLFRGALLDSHVKGAAGGTGETFDWASIPPSHRQSIILAGGLNPDNVAQAIRRVRPYAVDLSSGVESAPGIKDAELMAKLINEVKRVDCETG